VARKRIIDPEFWSDEEIGKWSHSARLFYIGLWNFADDEGRFKAHNALLKSQIFPYDTKIDIEALKKELNHKIQWYEVEGLQYGFIRNFLKHQRIDRPTSSKLPKPSKQLDDNSTIPRGDVLPNISKDNIREVNIREDKSVKDILSDLNIVLGTSYKTNSFKTKDLIQARIKEGFTVEDFKTVHRKMLRAWGTDEKMVKYLRPITLYGPKFESYLNQKSVTTKLTPEGVKAYLIGQDWLKSKEMIDVK
jgi:uncharacterized phage protein (TIGR02220 family)